MPKKSFTLIELMVVVFIVALLASLVVVQVNRSRIAARDARRISDLSSISSALAAFYADRHSFSHDIYTDTTFDSYLSTTPTDPRTHNNYSYSRYPSGCISAKHNCSCYVVSTTLEDSNHNPVDTSITAYSIKNGESYTTTSCP